MAVRPCAGATGPATSSPGVRLMLGNGCALSAPGNARAAKATPPHSIRLRPRSPSPNDVMVKYLLVGIDMDGTIPGNMGSCQVRTSLAPFRLSTQIDYISRHFPCAHSFATTPSFGTLHRGNRGERAGDCSGCS